MRRTLREGLWPLSLRSRAVTRRGGRSMKQLPSLKARDVIRALRILGFEKHRQRGGHLVLLNRATQRRTTIPIHGGSDIKKSLLKKIIEEDARISIEAFLRVL